MFFWIIKVIALKKNILKHDDPKNIKLYYKTIDQF